MRLRPLLPLCAALLLLLPQSGCGGQDHINVFHVTFTAGGVAKDFTTKLGFTNFTGGRYMISYFGAPDQTIADRNYLQINLPDTVKPGTTYTQSSPKVMLAYVDPNGVWYGGPNVPETNPSTFTLTVTDWPGIGGYAHGTFSGTLYDEQTITRTVVITNGKFEGFIHNQ